MVLFLFFFLFSRRFVCFLLFCVSQDAAAGFEDAKIKLEVAETKSAELEKEAASLKEKVRVCYIISFFS